MSMAMTVAVTLGLAVAVAGHDHRAPAVARPRADHAGRHERDHAHQEGDEEPTGMAFERRHEGRIPRSHTIRVASRANPRVSAAGSSARGARRSDRPAAVRPRRKPLFSWK